MEGEVSQVLKSSTNDRTHSTTTSPAFHSPPSRLTIDESARAHSVVNQSPRESRTPRPDNGALSSNHDGTSIAVAEHKPGFVSIVKRSLSFASPISDLGNRFEVSPAWRPSILQPLPLIGIAALLGTICCLFASLGILIGSHGQAADDWAWPPSVFLAIFSAIINKLMTFALIQALPIAWWHQAYQGATLAQLHRRWEAGEGMFRAIKNARYEKLLALATIACALVIMDGPFLQKASTIVSETQTKPTTLTFPVTPELPTGFSGNFDENGLATSWEVNPALEGFAMNSTIQANITGCRGSCRAKVHAPGVIIRDCSSKSWPLDRNMLTQNKSATWGSGNARHTGSVPLFNAQLHDSAMFPPFSGDEELELWIGIANFTNCSGDYIEQTCKVVAAILEYEVIIQDGNVLNFAKPPNEAPLVSRVNNTHVNASDENVPVTFTALGAFLEGQISANATMEETKVDKPGAPVWLPSQQSFTNFVTKYTIISALCESNFSDPTPDILSSFNNLMFRAGIVAASIANESLKMDPGLTPSQTIQANQTLTLNVFRSQLEWWAGAALLEILAVLAIAPVFWGWWRLGLKATMSPLEIAKAFDAPLLQDVNCAAGSRGIVRSVGERKVQFGARPDERFGEAKDGTEAEGRSTARLGIADAGVVVRPRKGQQFGS